VFALCSRKAEATIAGKRFVAKNGASFEADVREALAGARMSDAAAAAVKKTVGVKREKKLQSRGGETDAAKEKDGVLPREKKEKKKENKAAKKRRKRREEKERADKKAKAETGNET
jgi:hypothetical protein